MEELSFLCGGIALVTFTHAEQAFAVTMSLNDLAMELALIIFSLVGIVFALVFATLRFVL